MQFVKEITLYLDSVLLEADKEGKTKVPEIPQDPTTMFSVGQWEGQFKGIYLSSRKCKFIPILKFENGCLFMF